MDECCGGKRRRIDFSKRKREKRGHFSESLRSLNEDNRSVDNLK